MCKGISRPFLLVISLIAGLFLPTLLQAAEKGDIRLNNFVQTVVTLEAKFQQTLLDTQGNVIEEAQGTFMLERPGKFRWDYDQPYPQHIVADGDNIWFYDVDLEQVTVKSQSEALTDTPASLLSGVTLPEETYLVTNLPSEDGLAWVKLVPKVVENSFQIITLAFGKQGLRQMIMKDTFDQTTRLVFSKVKENIILPDDAFVFVPPQGVDVVGDLAQ